ncbi:MAG TPA: penicillin-binding protein 2 [Solirubrobacter sp.]|nr:penicillin-binding protein 2 [Solirubrobacter sp.]
MNVPIYRLFALFVVLFAVLVAFSSRWAVFGATALRENPDNSRVVLEEQRIKRGVIRAANNDVLAGSRALPDKRYERRYPTGSLFAQPVGFDSVRFGRAGLERYYNDALTGRKEELASIVDSLIERDRVGDDLHTTLEPKAQQVAFDQLGDRKGAVVALRVKDGAVLVLAGNPSFDPDKPNTMGINYATQGLFPPGSTFKTVTAAAALDTGRYEPGSRVNGRNGKIVSGTPLNNFGGADYGDITLTEALTHSVNTVWAEVGVKLGRGTMQEYMERFGFGEKPPMDYPADQMEVSGVRRRGKVISMSSRSVDVGRTAIGQALLLVTPLQMATVAQTIGNGGVRMEPRLVEKVVDPDGRTVDEPLPERAERVMSADAAAKLGTMMKSVVREGSGTAAALEGVELAGKTGTAEIDINRGINDLWFIGFTDEVAIAVVVDRQQGLGGTVAAPIAKNVLQALGQ